MQLLLIFGCFDIDVVVIDIIVVIFVCVVVYKLLLLITLCVWLFKGLMLLSLMLLLCLSSLIRHRHPLELSECFNKFKNPPQLMM